MTSPAQRIQQSLDRVQNLPHRSGHVDPRDVAGMDAATRRTIAELPDASAFATWIGLSQTNGALTAASSAYRDGDHTRAAAWLDHARVLLDGNDIPIDHKARALIDYIGIVNRLRGASTSGEFHVLAPDTPLRDADFDDLLALARDVDNPTAQIRFTTGMLTRFGDRWLRADLGDLDSDRRVLLAANRDAIHARAVRERTVPSTGEFVLSESDRARFDTLLRTGRAIGDPAARAAYQDGMREWFGPYWAYSPNAAAVDQPLATVHDTLLGDHAGARHLDRTRRARRSTNDAARSSAAPRSPASRVDPARGMPLVESGQPAKGTLRLLVAAYEASLVLGPDIDRVGRPTPLRATLDALIARQNLDRDPLVIDLVDRDWAATHTPALLGEWQRAITATGDYRAGRPAMDAIHTAKHWNPLLTTVLGYGVNDPRDLVPLTAALDRAAASGYDVAARLPTLATASPLSTERPGRELRLRLFADCPAAKPAAIPAPRRPSEQHPDAARGFSRMRERRTTRTPPPPSPPPPRPGPAR